VTNEGRSAEKLTIRYTGISSCASSPEPSWVNSHFDCFTPVLFLDMAGAAPTETCWIIPLPMPPFLGTIPTIFAKVSGLAGSFGIQLSGWALRMCSHIDRYAKF